MSAISADPEELEEGAASALEAGEEEQQLPRVLAAAERLRNPRLWQWAGLLQRSLDEYEAAVASFEEAVRLAPGDASIAHGRARVALEAGLPAVELFDQAASLTPADGSVLIGRAAARVAAGEGERASNEVAAILEQNPLWIEGHEQLAQLLATLGRAGEASESLERALRRFPTDQELWSALLSLHLRREDYRRLKLDAERAANSGVGPAALLLFQAIAAGELDDSVFPPALFGTPAAVTPQLAIWRVRHLLRVGAMSEASALIDAELGAGRGEDLWPYAAVVWRMTGNARQHWLEGDERFVAVLDVTPDLPPLDVLSATLRSLHRAKGEYLDQSVRGGTQTDGPLLSRVDPVVRKLRSAIVEAVEGYVEQLPPIDPEHPLLRHRRDRRIRFAGSWSVRLRGGGRHANHVHPQGWISSALYVSLPERSAAEPEDSGWLTLGQPQESLGLDLPPRRRIEPVVGRLVLFPSYMWHGTVPFSHGERLTVAFDVRPPI